MSPVVASEAADRQSSAPGSPLDSAGGSLVDVFLSWLCDSRGFSPATISTYRGSLSSFTKETGIIDFSTIATKDVDLFMRRLAIRGISPNTRRGRLNALKSLFKFLLSRGQIEKDPMVDVAGPVHRSNDGIPTFSTSEIERLIFGYSEPPPVRGKREPLCIFDRRERVQRQKVLRDTAMLAVAYSMGLRASEVGNLSRSDFLSGDGKADRLVIRGAKWSKEPEMFKLDNRVSRALTDYLRLRFAEELSPHPALFSPLAARRHDTRSPDRGVSRFQIAAIIEHRVSALGIDPRGRRLSPHTLRYSIATHLHESGLPDPELQTFMRHRSIDTTLRYVRLGSSRQIRRRANAMLYWKPMMGRRP